MPPRSRNSARKGTINIGGVDVTLDEVKHALVSLQDASGIMVRQPLLRVENPLGECDYHAVANEQRDIDGISNMSTKSAFLRALERHAGE